MKVLLDTCVWGGARDALVAAGHDVIWTGEWAADPGDDEILASAHAEGHVLVTLDKDFGELAVARENRTRASCASSACAPRSKVPRA